MMGEYFDAVVGGKDDFLADPGPWTPPWRDPLVGSAFRRDLLVRSAEQRLMVDPDVAGFPVERARPESPLLGLNPRTPSDPKNPGGFAANVTYYWDLRYDT